MFWFLFMLTGISDDVCDVLKERPFVATALWVSENVILPPGSELKGPYRLDLFPHTREVFDCFDDPKIQRISLQWASRLGKTATFLACMIKKMTTSPCPQAWGEADEKSVKRVFKRAWATMARCGPLLHKLPPDHLRSETHIALPDSQVHGAWSGSPASAADYGAQVVYKNEASKMTNRKSNEAPFAELIDERAKGFWNRKIMQASTPTMFEKCYIERERLAGDNRRRLVPCPHCNFFQELNEGVAYYDRKGTFLGLKNGGLRWDKSSNGHSSPDVALLTAWYECCACKRKIREEHRFEMLNAGKWVPEGCEVNSNGVMTGKPLRPGNHASFGPLSSLHSLIPGVTLGLVAHESVKSRQKDSAIGDPQAKRRNFINSWMGLTWSDAPKASEPNELAARLCVPGQYIRVCPSWVRFLTRASDLQTPDQRFEFWWQVWGWGEGGRGAMIDYGVSDRESLSNEIQTRWYDHADGGPKLRPVISLIDSGDGEFSTEVYNFCKQFRGVYPSKGSSTSKFPTMYRLSGLEDSSNKNKDLQLRLGGLYLFEVNHEKTNWWVENSITGINQPPDPNGISFPEELAFDDEFFRQWTAEYPARMFNDEGYELHEWKRRYKNEWRDAARYNCVGAWYFTKGGLNWNKLPVRMSEAELLQARMAAQARAREQQEAMLRTPDGRPYFVGNR